MEMEAKMKSMGRVPMKCDKVIERNISTSPRPEAVPVRRNDMQVDPMTMFVLKIGLKQGSALREDCNERLDRHTTPEYHILTTPHSLSNDSLRNSYSSVTFQPAG